MGPEGITSIHLLAMNEFDNYKTIKTKDINYKEVAKKVFIWTGVGIGSLLAFTSVIAIIAVATMPPSDEEPRIAATEATLSEPQTLPEPEVVSTPEPKPEPKPEPVDTTPDYKYTYDYAKTEICEAGQQYVQDMLKGYMGKEGVRKELSLYSKYLAQNSPAGGIELMLLGKRCAGIF
jgi:hypothetical protein